MVEKPKGSSSNGTEPSFFLVQKQVPLCQAASKLFRHQWMDKESSYLSYPQTKILLPNQNLLSLLINHTIKILSPSKTTLVSFLRFRHEIFDFHQSCIWIDHALQTPRMPFVRNHRQRSESLQGCEDRFSRWNCNSWGSRWSLLVFRCFRWCYKGL